MAITSVADVQARREVTLTAVETAQVEAYIRGAERSLAGMVGVLAGHDPQLVKDVVVDAVQRRMENPRGIIAETDGDYSYRLAKGVDGWWWPEDWRRLFGVPEPKTSTPGTILVGLSPRWGGQCP